MRRRLADALHSLANWLFPKMMPPSLTGNQWTGTASSMRSGATATRHRTSCSPS
jgi:hypothetical protein